MNKENLNIQEDAKSDWMKVVNKHKRRQKCLPALSKLNTNAGNVEHNINMFNKLNAADNISVDTVNGNNTTEVTNITAALHENFTEFETVTLSYTDLPIQVYVPGTPGGRYNSRLGGWLPDDDTEEIMIDWDYDVGKDEVTDFLVNFPKVMIDLDADLKTDEEYIDAVINNFDTLFEKYETDILLKFQEDAIRDAEENYDPPYYESLRKTKIKLEQLDDIFDMSMRTLL